MDENDDRRKAIATGALASGAIALGVGGGTATAQQADSALVFTYDFVPNRRFVETAQLQQGTTNGILQDVVSQPDEWTGFIGRYQETDEDPGEFFITFTRDGSLGTGTFSADVTFFATEANLLTASIQGEEETTTPEEDEETTEMDEETTPEEDEETTEMDEETTPEEDEETTTPEEDEETTEEVVVETTTTETNGG